MADEARTRPRYAQWAPPADLVFALADGWMVRPEHARRVLREGLARPDCQR
jgi:hypothetical protein